MKVRDPTKIDWCLERGPVLWRKGGIAFNQNECDPSLNLDCGSKPLIS